LFRLTVICFSTFLFFFSNPLFANFEAAIEANQKGDRATAFKEFHAAALKKDERAYGRLGSMYLYGLGTQKNYHNAYIWFHMAYLSGEREGERFRDAASSMLNQEKYQKAVKAAEKQRVTQGLAKTPPQNKPPGAKNLNK